MKVALLPMADALAEIMPMLPPLKVVVAVTLPLLVWLVRPSTNTLSLPQEAQE